MENGRIVFFALIIIFALGILRILSDFRKKRNNRKRQELLLHANLIDKEVTYAEYQKVAQRLSVSNTQARTNGSFLDFIIPVEYHNNDTNIESHLSSASCGEDYHHGQ